jgi:hypothetical protein
MAAEITNPGLSERLDDGQDVGREGRRLLDLDLPPERRGLCRIDRVAESPAQSLSRRQRPRPWPRR